MSTTVDERVVEMRFDNKQFESNVSASMSTLDKLKSKLSFKGATKGLETLNTATKNINMNGLGQGIDTVNAKFSTLQVMGMTAIANLTNSAVNAGKKIVSALTIDPVMDGFREYETQLNAVQTILANTQSEGTNVKVVNKALDKLNKYADKTIYNFTEMTRNIGTFTAAGVKLNDSVNAIKGIANLAAVSGSNSQQASTVMYQLSQALAAGKVNLQDWNSVVNAGMGGKVFQDALIRTSEHLKTGAKNAIKAKGSFRESLRTGWMTQEVLTQTLDQFATAAETQEEYEAAIKKFVKQGYTQEEAKQMADMARTAGDAATKVKTFTQLIDTLKEALGSGWSQTWRLIFGDFEEAKSLWTGISEVLGGFIDKTSKARNKLLKSALGKGFGKLTEKINDVIEPAKKAGKTIKKTVDAVSDLGDVVDEVIGGKFGDGKERFDALTKAGYNWCEVQNKVNEKLGNTFRYTEKQIEAQGKSIKGIKEESKETIKLTKEKKNLIKKVANMTEEQMRSAGYEDKQIAAFKELGDTAKKLGMPLNEFIDNMDKITGRWLLIESFKNIGRSIAKVFSSIGKAWKQTFKAIKPDTIFNLLAGFHKLTRSLILSDKESKKLVRTFKGLFALLDIITTIVGGGFKLAFKVASAILGAFGLDLLDATAILGDFIVKFRDFLFDNNMITKAFSGLASGVKMVVKVLSNLVDAVRNSEIGKNIIAGLKNGLEKGITEIPQMLINIGKGMLEAICNVLGIHSPSVEMEKIGKFTIEGLINGLKSGVVKVWDVLSNLGTGVIDFIKYFNWDKAFAVGASVFLLMTVKKMVDIVDSISAPFAGLGDLLSGAGKVLSKSARGVKKVLKGFGKVLNAKAFKIKAEALKDVAISIGILAASVYMLAQLDIGTLWSAVVAIGALSLILIGLSIAMDKLSSASIGWEKGKGLDIKGLKTGLLGIGLAILLIAASVKLLSGLNKDQAIAGFGGLAGVIVAIGAVFAAYGLLVKGKAAQNMDKAGKMMRKMAITMLLMIAVAKLAGTLDLNDAIKGGIFMVAFAGFVAAMSFITTLSGKGISKLGGMMLNISLAMLLMVGVCKLVGKLSADEMIKGGAFALAFVIFVKLLIKVTKIGKEDQIAKLSGLLMSISFAMLLMVGVCKLVGMLSIGELLKGAGFATAFILLIKSLVAVTKIGKEEQMAKVAGTILATSFAIAVMAGVCILLGLISLPDLVKGVAAVIVFGLLIRTMITATKGANDIKGNLIAISVAIGIMAAAVALLSFIDPTKLAGATLAMSMLMGMFALMSFTAKFAQNAMGSLIVLTVAVGIIAGIIYLLSTLQVDSVLGVAASLSLLLLSMSASLALISIMGPMATTGLLALAGLTLIVAALAGILYLLQGMDPTQAIGTAIAITTFLAGMSTCCLILSVVGALGPAAIIGVASLLALIVSVGGLMVAIGALVTYFPQLEEFLNKGIPILEKIGNGIGAFFGGIINGFGVAATAGLPKIAANLSSFMNGLQPFINGANRITEESVSGVKSLVAMIAMISGANILESITSFLTGGSSIEKFASQINIFGDAIVAFSNKIKGKIDPESVTAAASAGKMLAEMINTLPSTGGLFQLFTGEKNFAEFKSQLTSFGDAIVSFSDKVSGSSINEGAIKAAANAGKIMIAMQDKLAATGGVFQWFTGKKNMADFGKQLKVFGKALTDFSTNTKVNETAVTAAANAGKIMASLQESLPESHWFDGKTSLDKFGKKLVGFGEGISDFSDEVKEISSSAMSSAISTAYSLATLTRNIVDLDTSGISDFEDVEDIGSAIKSYYDEVSKIKNSVITNSISSANSLIAMAKQITNDYSSGISNFKKITLIGSSLYSYAQRVSGINMSKISSSIQAIKQLKQLLNSISNMKTNSVAEFNRALSELSKTSINGFVNSFSGSGHRLLAAGTNIMDSLIKGIVSRQTGLHSTIRNMINGITKSITISSAKFERAGNNLVAGLIIGMRSQVSQVYHAGYVLGSTAVQGEKDGQRSNSPSKLTMENGKYLGEGLIIGIDSMISKVYNKGYGLGESATDSISKAISKISDVVKNGIDASPTIKPVLDLSNVTSGAKSIGELFNRQSVSVTSNLNSISSSMNRQNGNYDLLHEIKGLRGDLAAIDSGVNVEVNLDYKAGADANQITNDIAKNLRRVIRRG